MRLRERGPELEERVLAAARFGRSGTPDESPEVFLELQAGLTEGLAYAIKALAGDDFRALPSAVSERIHRAARLGARLDSALRLCVAGERVLGEAILEETENFPLPVLKAALRALGLWSDRWMAAISREFAGELERRRRSPATMAAEQIGRLLAGDPGPLPENVHYRFDGWHLGVIVWGSGGEEALRAIAARLDRTLLAVPQVDGVLWGWLGGRGPLPVQVVEQVAASLLPDGASLAIGEPHQGISGWRRTHHEAQVGLRVMLQRPEKVTRGSSVVLLAALLRDQALADLVKGAFLQPLEADNSGEGLCRTVRTYLEYGFNASSTSAALEIDRSTVQRHLHEVEQP